LFAYDLNIFADIDFAYYNFPGIICFGVLSRIRIKYLTSLRIKKYRTHHGQFIVEGDKIIRDIIQTGKVQIRQLIATKEWLAENQLSESAILGEIIQAEPDDISRISSLETPSSVLAVMDVSHNQLMLNEISRSWSLALDNIQDPGNLGNIIRTADWFGIQNIICSRDCADCYNPKAVQASMGALLNVRVHYVRLTEILDKLPKDSSFRIYGTFIKGISVYDIPTASQGLIIFGNEAHGISTTLIPFIHSRISIPPAKGNHSHIESLNVASAVAVVCALLISH
jgi:TrmH family RNA methyltransferase